MIARRSAKPAAKRGPPADSSSPSGFAPAILASSSAAWADRLQISDIANRGAIATSGLKEGDEIVSVNGKPVSSEREFVDTLFADHEANKPAQVVIKRNGQQQNLSINTKPFVDEHLNSDNQLHDFGLVLDESDPAHVKVQTVIPRSPAFYGGMKSGDVVTRINGERINAVKDLVQTIAGVAGGTTTSVEVKRNGGSRSLDIDVPDINSRTKRAPR